MGIVFEIKKGISHVRIKKNGIPAKCVFHITRALYVLVPIKKRKLDYVEVDSNVVVLIPLCGSSSVRSIFNSQRAESNYNNYNKKYVILRDEEERKKSFFNKKIIAATTVGKVAYLATCIPFTMDTDEISFELQLKVHMSRKDADKHLVPVRSLVSGFLGSDSDFHELHLVNDIKTIESVLKIESLPKRKSSLEVMK